MQMVITFMAVVAGLIFSVAVALLAEESGPPPPP